MMLQSARLEPLAVRMSCGKKTSVQALNLVFPRMQNHLESVLIWFLNGQLSYIWIDLQQSVTLYFETPLKNHSAGVLSSD